MRPESCIQQESLGFFRANWVPLSTEEKDLMLRKALVELGGGDEMKRHFLSFLFHL